ncbi:hypothetical protein N5P18_05935 [Janibacter terrae]|uniref:Uncharacterized protein n=1 Tax=Janibacter terrae TaxID=103817 RepID=A0ABZ2FGG3_9MICO|nr:hypothetical protein [Janibacter terrae]HCE61011.1 hypothetical protein [Janibacter terrae]
MTHRTRPVPDHTAELTALRARLYSPELSPLEAAGMLAAVELLRRHEQGSFEICQNPSSVALVRLCLGRRFELVHDEDEECTCCCHD